MYVIKVIPSVVAKYCKSCFKIEIKAVLITSSSTDNKEVQRKMNRKLTPQS